MITDEISVMKIINRIFLEKLFLITENWRNYKYFDLFLFKAFQLIQIWRNPDYLLW